MRCDRATAVAVGQQYHTMCMFVASVTQHAMPMRHIVIYGLIRSTLFFPLISQTARFSTKRYSTQNVCFEFSATIVTNISISKRKWVKCDQKNYIGLHVKYPLLLSDFNETWIFSTDLGKMSNVKFHENPSSWVAELFHAYRQRQKDIWADRNDDAKSRFSKFSENA
jgi:hypothetical protein